MFINYTKNVVFRAYFPHYQPLEHHKTQLISSPALESTSVATRCLLSSSPQAVSVSGKSWCQFYAVCPYMVVLVVQGQGQEHNLAIQPVSSPVQTQLELSQCFIECLPHHSVYVLK